jgi:chloramphenicol 3-O phosphotransferase
MILLALGSIILAFLFLYTPEADRSDQPCLANPIAKGTIVILNGAPSVGKSTIQAAFQEVMAEPYLALGVDTFLMSMLPNRLFTGDFLQRHRPAEGVDGLHGYYEIESSDQPVYKFEFGPAARNLVRGMHHAFAALASERNNLVINYILYDPAWLVDLVDALYGYRVYFVGLRAPLEVIEQREKNRDTSPSGHARAYYSTVHKHGEYDLILDTAQLTPEQAAQTLKEYIEQHPEPRAFRQLYKKFIG